IVHLFQLRKFRKESFTNVKFLKKLSRQTRKSSQLKKWLVLATRLLLLASIILAFARPYFPSENLESNDIETVIYLDNSYSMQATGERGRLLERNIQELLEQLPEDRSFTLITNNDEISEVSRRDLQEITYSATPADLNSIFLRAQNKFSGDSTSVRKLLLISDFEKDFDVPGDFLDSGFEIFALPQQPRRLENISIDTLYQNQAASGGLSITVGLSFTGNNPGNVPVSIFNGGILLGKSGLDFEREGPYEIEFSLDISEISEGVVSIEDNGPTFDNSMYFSVNRQQPITLVSIDEADSRFLQRIFKGPEFDFSSMPAGGINYQTLTAARVIILNELQDLSGSLAATLTGLANNNEVIFIIIPSPDVTGTGLTAFLRDLGFRGYGEKREQERLVTGISFGHPLFSEVFEEQVKNFEYPKVQLSFSSAAGGRPVLSFENNEPFLLESGGHYFFTAPLNSGNSNFVQSPLIVPVFYNMGISALKPAGLYYNLGMNNKIEVPINLPGDRILKIEGAEENFIPQQQRFSGKVEVLTGDLPKEAGNYTITRDEEKLMYVSYNVPRNESRQEYIDLSKIENITVIEELPQFFSSAGFAKELDTLWKWFVTFALIFLIIETLLLKYFK
ncbi:MAG TPA: BatA domain-containing protein, partial [Gillisia sp.]|nr:BatA domain-containing protein [Gillisia sp.]